jgi:hypothetical protein
VDFLVERGEKLVGIEVKWGHRINDSDSANLVRCTQELKDQLHLFLILYGRTEIVPIGPRTLGIPFPVFFGVE